MFEIKAKEVAFLRTTGEAVFVLAIHAATEEAKRDYEALTPLYAVVKYAMVAKNSINHIVITFWVDELMTRAERDALNKSARESQFEDLFKNETQQQPAEQQELPFKVSEVN